jgi:translation initiation factor IF-2
MPNPKVFEYAKEIGMTPLALMDKIREWKLPVKSHMAELEPELLTQIQEKLKSGFDKKEVSAKKATPKKKAAEGAVVGPKKSSSTAKSSAPLKASTPRTTAAEADKVAEEKASSATKTASTVIRRKAKLEEQKVEAVVAQDLAAADTDSQEPVIENKPAQTPPAAVAQAPAVVAKTVATKVEAPKVEVKQSSEVKPSVEEAEKKPAALARKKEVAIGASGVMSDAPVQRKNIVGRMDLSRVSAPAGAAGGGRDRRPVSVGAQNRPKGHVRAGFFQAAAPIPEPVVESDDYLKRKEEKRRSKVVSEGGAAKPAEEEELKHFDASEFRKREMVFQPKKKKNLLTRPAMQTVKTTPKASKRIVKVNQTMKVADLAVGLGVKAPELIKSLMKSGVTASINTPLDFDTIALIVQDFGFEAQNVYQTAEQLITKNLQVDESKKVLRPPVVTVMGHVDHGKTSLLDAIRNANVAAGEAGGITQHIGAYQVKTEAGAVITFLDTPGHEAFTSMRARGANVTDIAVIVVAADDGVMPQTVEAVSHAKAAQVPIIVAVNKMDKPGANPDRVKKQLTEYEIVPEEWGGQTIFVNVSALKRTGIDQLLEQIMLVAEVSDLKASPSLPGTGIVIESKLEKGRGPVATLLVKDGTLNLGNFVVAGTAKGKVRSLVNDRGERVESAGPGVPVALLGLDEVPLAGDRFDIVKDEKMAEEAVRIRKEKLLAEKTISQKLSLEQIFSKVKQGDVKELSVVLKADVAGSLEAIQGMFAKLTSAEVKVRVIHAAVGGITESDVLLASTAKGIVVGFNVRPDGGATQEAKRLGVDVRSYTIVYELMDEMKKAMQGLLSPDVVERQMGRAEVRNTFGVPKIGTIAGCAVVDGKVQRSNLVRLIRDGKIVYEGKISSLKRFKDDAREVAQGFECGIGIENFNDVKVGDVIEAFVKEEKLKELTF